MRVLLLQNIINPHMAPAFLALSQIPGVQLTVAYFAETEGDRDWSRELTSGLDERILAGRRLDLRLRWDTYSLHFNRGLATLLDSQPWDAVINSGWASPSNWLAFLHCMRRKIPQVLWAGSTAAEKSPQRTLTLPAVRWLVRRSDAWVAYGTAASQYLQSLGADPSRISLGYHCVDNLRVLERLGAAGPAAEKLREQYQLTGRRIALFVGRAVDTKGGMQLVRATARAAKANPELRSVLVGDGPALADWRREAIRTRAPCIFPGATRSGETAAWYRLAHLFVLPSTHEVWGLVANEAALAGLPLALSENCGAAADLLRDGENGFLLRGRGTALEPELSKVLRTLCEEPARLEEMGAVSRTMVEQLTPANLARAFESAARAAAAARGRS